MEVVGAAPDPLVAREMIRSLNPDVITLDVEMPKMDGLDFLEKLMRLRPMPVVMISSLTERGAEVTLRALELGAVDFVSKPKIDIEQRRARLRARRSPTRSARPARAKVRKHVPRTVTAAQKADAVLPLQRAPHVSTEKLIVIGASTGGTEAIREVLVGMPPDCPGILITQHMPAAFTRSFAERLEQPVPDHREGSRGTASGSCPATPTSRRATRTCCCAASGANYVPSSPTGRR